MRISIVAVAVLLAAGPAFAQQDPPAEAVGDLAEVMRGILFPNSNLIFDAQTSDPGAPPEAAGGDSATARFSGIYSGWEAVENAAIALAEAANLITLPRNCENVEDDPARNGLPVPIESDDWKEYVAGLRAAGLRAYDWAQRQAFDEDEIMMITGDVSEACSNCHRIYRDSYDDPPKPRCQP
jgi:hypothetical protein